NPEVVKADLTPAELNAITSRVMEGQLNADDKDLLGVTLWEILNNAREFRSVKGTYFPLMRYGDHVVRTEDKITDTMGGTLVEPDTVLFKNKSDTAARRAAEAFVRKTDLLHIGTKRVYFDANTGEQVTLDESRSLDDVEYGYLVKLQTKGVYFFESRAQAHRFKEE